MSIKEIEAVITQLSVDDLAQFVTWLDEYRAEIVDKQIEEDIEAGRFDVLLAEANKEYEAGLARPI